MKRASGPAHGRKIILILAWFFALAIGAPVLAVGGLLAYMIFGGPDFDDGAHPGLEALLRQPGGSTVDLSGLNGGDWNDICVFGGYNDPVAHMRQRGAAITEADQRRFEDARHRAFRLYPVEESEIAVAYIDRAGRTYFVHLRRGFGPEGQGYLSCISRPETRVTLPDPALPH